MVYLFPMLGFRGPGAVVAIQVNPNPNPNPNRTRTRTRTLPNPNANANPNPNPNPNPNQLGYCAADIISKCGVGFLIYNITVTKSAALNEALLGGRKK